MDGKTILAADDDEFTREMMEMAIQGAGFGIDPVEDGKQAVDKYNAA